MPSSTITLLVLSATLAVGAASRADAQDVEPVGAHCDGLRVSRIDIEPARPSFAGQASRWRNLARAVGLHHATTRDGVVEAFLALQVNGTCTEVRRAESERLLRAQPFLASATVRTTPDDSGGVVVIVRTVDEIPVLVNARFRGLAPRTFSLGNENVGGLGLLLEGGIERGFAYRTGFGVRVVEFATFGRPYVATFEGARNTMGHRLRAALEHPFYTDLQRIAWHVGYFNGNEFPGIRRPANDQLALGVRQEREEGSSIVRVGGAHIIGLFGVAASRIRLIPQASGVVVSDTGLVADTGTTLLNRYAPFEATRVGVLGGVRRVTFHTVRGFDALTGQQDVANGMFAGLYVAKGMPSLGESDLFLQGIVFAGAGGGNLYLATLAQWEGRHPTSQGGWDSVIGSGRTAVYIGRGPGWLFSVNDEFSAGINSLLPLQLSLSDRQGGILGYHSSTLAGSYRNVVRSEARWTGEALIRGADVGFAAFSHVGSIWAGDAPYGSTATRTSVGISVLAAYPSGSKRTYRADVGFPLTRQGEGRGSIEVRFSSEDRTQLFWREPADVSRARTGTVPTTLFAFPTR